jgi:hypothetical protein
MRYIAICLFLAASAHGSKMLYGANAFYVASSPTSKIAFGATILATPENGYGFNSKRTFDAGVRTNDVEFNVSKVDDKGNLIEIWTLDFVGANKTLAVVGTYTDAVRFPFQTGTQPGLSFTGNNFGDNTLTGSFNVLDAEFDGSGKVSSFAADFTQYDEGNTTRWNQGSIRYNSDIPITPVPEPSTVTLLAIGGIGLFMRRRAQACSIALAVSYSHRTA